MKQYINYDQSSNYNNSFYYYFTNFFKRIGFLLLIVLCIVFIGLSKVHKHFQEDISEFFTKISLPVSNIIALPFQAVSGTVNYAQDLVTARQTNIELKAENERLKSIYLKSLYITQENEELKTLLNFIGTKTTKYQTVRLVAKPNQTYRSSIIINAGRNQGIKENHVIIGRKSVIGRVVNVENNTSRVLTIDDETSKIPVITSNSWQKGILTGHGNNSMTIEYLDKDHNIKAGDYVFSAGDGDFLPPGIFVGIVTKVNKQYVAVKAIEHASNTNLAVISEH